METSTHALLGAWESFYVIVGSSAAALTGLQFVVIALIADMPGLRAGESVAAFGTPTVFHFCACLFVAALLSAPWPSLFLVDLFLIAAAVTGLAYALVVIRRARRQTTYEPVAEDWIWHAILPTFAYAVIVVAALALRAAPVPMLFVVAGMELLLIFIGIHNAWDTVAYLATEYRKGSREETSGT